MSSSEEPNTTPSLPPPPVPVIAPTKTGLVDVPDAYQVVWYHGKFGGNGFGFFGTGRLGVSEMAVVLTGHRMPQFWRSNALWLSLATFIPFNILGRIPLFGSPYFSVILFGLLWLLFDFAILHTVKRYASPEATIGINRFKLTVVKHHQRWFILAAPDERGKSRLINFLLPTPQEAEAIVAELVITAQT